jgi:hypothetical protein
MKFKNTKPTAAEFFRKYSDLVSEAEGDEAIRSGDEGDEATRAADEKNEREKAAKKTKKTLKEFTQPTKWEQMMGITPKQLTEKYMGFEKVEKAVSKNPKVRDPGAVAASIGRKKYGKEKFQKMAAAGKKDEGCMEESIRSHLSPGDKIVVDLGQLGGHQKVTVISYEDHKKILDNRGKGETCPNNSRTIHFKDSKGRVGNVPVRNVIAESEHLDEKWNGKAEFNPAKKGMFKGKKRLR